MRRVRRLVSILGVPALSGWAQGPGDDPSAPAAADPVPSFEVLGLSPAGAFRVRLNGRDAGASVPTREDGTTAHAGFALALLPILPGVDGAVETEADAAFAPVEVETLPAEVEVFPSDGEERFPGPYRLWLYRTTEDIPEEKPVREADLWVGDFPRWLQAWEKERTAVRALLARWKGGGSAEDRNAVADLPEFRCSRAPERLGTVCAEEEREKTLARVEEAAASGKKSQKPPGRFNSIPFLTSAPPGSKEGGSGEGGGAGQPPPGGAPPDPSRRKAASAMETFLDFFRRETLASLALAAEFMARAAPAGPPAAPTDWKAWTDAARAAAEEDPEMKRLADSVEWTSLVKACPGEPGAADLKAFAGRARSVRAKLEGVAAGSALDENRAVEK